MTNIYLTRNKNTQSVIITLIGFILLTFGINLQASEKNGSDIQNIIEFYNNAEFQLARTKLSEFINSSNNSIEDKILAYQYLASTFFALNEPEKAKNEYRNMLSLSPDVQFNNSVFGPEQLQIFEETKKLYTVIVNITTQPTDALVTIGKKSIGKLRSPIRLYIGSIEVLIQKEGYRDVKLNLEISKDKNNFNFSMYKKLVINTINNSVIKFNPYMSGFDWNYRSTAEGNASLTISNSNGYTRTMSAATSEGNNTITWNILEDSEAGKNIPNSFTEGNYLYTLTVKDDDINRPIDSAIESGKLGVSIDAKYGYKLEPNRKFDNDTSNQVYFDKEAWYKSDGLWDMGGSYAWLSWVCLLAGTYGITHYDDSTTNSYGEVIPQSEGQKRARLISSLLSIGTGVFWVDVNRKNVFSPEKYEKIKQETNSVNERISDKNSRIKNDTQIELNWQKNF